MTTDDVDMKTPQAILQIAPPTGKIPVKIVLMGVPGVGKTTLAAQFPNPIFLDVEQSTTRMKPQPARLPNTTSYSEAKKQVGQILNMGHDYKTLVIDSLSVLENLIEENVCASNNVSSIEDLPYGRGYKLVEEEIRKLLDFLDRIVNEKNMNIVLIGHSIIRPATEPGSPTQYDRYELNLSKRVLPTVKGWSDAVLFCNYKTIVVEGKRNQSHAIGGTQRMIWTQHSATIDAKNRFNLAPQIEMTITALKPIFD